MYGKGWRVCLYAGPSDPLIRLWITVKHDRLGGTQIPHGVGGELWWNPCLFDVFGVFYES